jgi:hypothetical protein
MNVKKQILRSVVVMSTALVPAAGVVFGDGGGRALRPGAELAEPVRDGGAVFVDVGDGEALELMLEWRSDPQGFRPSRAALRLAGGTPGNVGAIVLSLSAERRAALPSLDSAVIPGVFGPDGSIVVELPRREGTVFAQGFEVTRADDRRSGIREIAPEGGIATAAISAAVRGAASEAPVSLRFFGAARLAGLQRSVDATVVLGRDLASDGYVLAVPAALARRTALVGRTLGDGVLLRFRDVEELTAAVEAVTVLAAFADLGPTRRSFTVQGPFPGSLVDDGGEVVAQFPEDEGIDVTFDPLARLDKPERAGEKHPLPTPKGTVARHDGALGDAGERTLTSSLVESALRTLDLLRDRLRQAIVDAAG